MVEPTLKTEQIANIHIPQVDPMQGVPVTQPLIKSAQKIAESAESSAKAAARAEDATVTSQESAKQSLAIARKDELKIRELTMRILRARDKVEELTHKELDQEVREAKLDARVHKLKKEAAHEALDILQKRFGEAIREDSFKVEEARLSAKRRQEEAEQAVNGIIEKASADKKRIIAAHKQEADQKQKQLTEQRDKAQLALETAIADSSAAVREQDAKGKAAQEMSTKTRKKLDEVEKRIAELEKEVSDMPNEERRKKAEKAVMEDRIHNGDQLEAARKVQSKQTAADNAKNEAHEKFAQAREQRQKKLDLDEQTMKSEATVKGEQQDKTAEYQLREEWHKKKVVAESKAKLDEGEADEAREKTKMSQKEFERTVEHMEEQSKQRFATEALDKKIAVEEGARNTKSEQLSKQEELTKLNQAHQKQTKLEEEHKSEARSKAQSEAHAKTNGEQRSKLEDKANTVKEKAAAEQTIKSDDKLMTTEGARLQKDKAELEKVKAEWRKLVYEDSQKTKLKEKAAAEEKSKEEGIKAHQEDLAKRSLTEQKQKDSEVHEALEKAQTEKARAAAQRHSSAEYGGGTSEYGGDAAEYGASAKAADEAHRSVKRSQARVIDRAMEQAEKKKQAAEQDAKKDLDRHLTAAFDMHRSGSAGAAYWNDISGNSNDAKLANGAVILPNGVLDVSKTNGAVALIQNSDQMRPQGSFSIEAWIRPSTLDATSGGGLIFAMVGSYNLELATGGRIRVYCTGLKNPGYHYSKRKLEVDTPAHVAFVWDGDAIRVFINSQLEVLVRTTGTPQIETSQPVFIGSFNSGEYKFWGQIMVARFYGSFALSDEDVYHRYLWEKDRFPAPTEREHYRSLESAVTAWFQFEHDAEDRKHWNDLSHHDNDLTLQGGARITDDGALDLRSPLSAASMRSKATLEPTTSFSVEAWIQPTSLAVTSGGGFIMSRFGMWSVELAEKGHIRVSCNGTAPNSVLESKKALNTEDVWNVVYVFDGLSHSIYLNGELDSTAAANGPPKDMYPGYEVWVGANGRSPGTSQWHGMVYQLRFYNNFALLSHDVWERYKRFYRTFNDFIR